MKPRSAPAEPAAVGARNGADSPKLLGRINDRIVLGLLLDHGPLTRSRIGELTGLSKPTVSALLERLVGRALVEPAGFVGGGPGPRARVYRIYAGAGHVIGIHAEQFGSTAALASLTGDILATHAVSVPRRSESDPRGEVRQAVDGVLAAAGLDRTRVDRIVLATPGVINPVTGGLRHAQHLQGWESPTLRTEIAADLRIPVSHGNDVNLAAVAEGLTGAARGHADYALLWLGQGVGLGLVLGGALRVGAHGGAGEIGYLPSLGFAAPSGVGRGATGAFQESVGGQGIRALAAAHGIGAAGRTAPADIVRQAVESGHAGRALLTALAAKVATGVAAVAAIVDPGLIVLGGPVALAGGSPLVELVTDAVTAQAFVPPPIVLSASADQSVLYGAIEVALQHVRAQLFGRPITGLLG